MEIAAVESGLLAQCITSRRVSIPPPISKGEITLSHWIEVATEEGDTHVVTFGDIVTINA